jgi:hypothetical protein
MAFTLRGSILEIGRKGQPDEENDQRDQREPAHPPARLTAAEEGSVENSCMRFGGSDE